MCGADIHILASCIEDLEFTWREFGLWSQIALNCLSLDIWPWKSHIPYIHNVCVVTFIWWEGRVNLIHASQLSDKLACYGWSIRDIYC